MTITYQIEDSLNAIQERLELDAFQPSPHVKHDRSAVGLILRDVKSKLIEPLPDLLSSPSTDADNLQLRLLRTSLDAVGLAIAAGEPDVAKQLLQAVRAIGHGSPLEGEMVVAEDEPYAFAQLIYGRWLHRRGHFLRANWAFRRALKLGAPASAATTPMSTQSGTPITVRASAATSLRDLVQAGLDAPRPITFFNAPHMTTVNGCGITAYGKRDPWPDGSYVTTLWVVFIFIPLFPISSYRVMATGPSKYRFYFALRLGRAARLWRASVVALIPLTVTASMVSTEIKESTLIFDYRITSAANRASIDIQAALTDYRAAANSHPGAALEHRISAAHAAVALRTGDGIPTVEQVREAFHDVAAFGRDAEPFLAPALADRVLALLTADDNTRAPGSPPNEEITSLVVLAVRNLSGDHPLRTRAEQMMSPLTLYGPKHWLSRQH